MEKIDNFIESIFQTSITNIPSNEEWDNVKINAYVLNRMVEISASYERNGEIRSFNPKNQGQVSRDRDLTFLFKDLREEMYARSPDNGAWFTAIFTAQNGGKFHTHFEYNEKPSFTYEPSKEKFVDDLNKFPRKNNLIPDWLNAIVNS